jgi:hypothetical protein
LPLSAADSIHDSRVVMLETDVANLVRLCIDMLPDSEDDVYNVLEFILRCAWCIYIFYSVALTVH